MDTWFWLLWNLANISPATGEEPMGIGPYLIAGAAILLVIIVVLVSSKKDPKNK